MLVCGWFGYPVVFLDACYEHFAQCITCEPGLWLASLCTVCSGSYLPVRFASESFTFRDCTGSRNLIKCQVSQLHTQTRRPQARTTDCGKRAAGCGIADT